MRPLPGNEERIVSPHQRAVIVVECVNEGLALKRGIFWELGMKAGRGFYDWPPEKIAAEKTRYEAALRRGLAILRADDESN